MCQHFWRSGSLPPQELTVLIFEVEVKHVSLPWRMPSGITELWSVHLVECSGKTMKDEPNVPFWYVLSTQESAGQSFVKKWEVPTPRLHVYRYTQCNI